MGANNAKINPFPLIYVDPIYSTWMPGTTHSPSQTTAPSVHTLPHNYATNSPLIIEGRPQFTPKLLLPSTITTSSNTSIPRSTPITIPNGIRVHSAVLPQYTFQTDTHTLYVALFAVQTNIRLTNMKTKESVLVWTIVNVRRACLHVVDRFCITRAQLHLSINVPLLNHTSTMPGRRQVIALRSIN